MCQTLDKTAIRGNLGSATLTVVIPVFNEEAVLGSLFESLEAAFCREHLEDLNISEVLYVFVDDGSSDASSNMIASFIADGHPAVLLRLSRNFGHQNAITAGLDYAHSDLVAVMDADLQDPPEIILDMVAKWTEGYDVVHAVRLNRKEGVIKVFCYRAFYWILSMLSDVPISRDSGDFCVMDRKVVEAIRCMTESLRFPRGARSWVGFRQTSLQYNRPQRLAGTTKYSFAKLYKLATDGIAWLSIKPLKLTQFAMLTFSILMLGSGFFALLKYLSYSPEREWQLWFLAMFALLFFGFFLISLCLYIISAYLGRAYLEVKSRPAYVVMEKLGKQVSRSSEEPGYTRNSRMVHQGGYVSTQGR